MNIAGVAELSGPLVPLRYDVVVAGGGTAGMVAAIAAARAGAKTLLVERGNCLGGTATAGLIVQFGGGGYPFMTGIMKELLDELSVRGDAIDLGQPNVNYPFDPDGLKNLAFEKLNQAGAELLLYSPVVGVLCEKKCLRGILVENKSGRCVIEAQVVIDATGDADVVARSGAEVLKLPGGGILGAIVGNIDFKEMRAYVSSNPDQVFETDLSKPLIRIAGFSDAVEKAVARGDLDTEMMRIPRHLVETEGTIEGARQYLRVDGIFEDKGLAMIGYGAHVDFDATDAFSVTRAEMEARRKHRKLLGFFRNYIPGFRNCYIVQTASSIAIWKSRKIVGEYVLTSEDIQSSRKFHDVVVNAHTNLDHRALYIKELLEFDIPFRAMLPYGYDGIIVAGRCISTTPTVQIPGFNMPLCMQMGEVAGTAAAMSVASGVSPRHLAIGQLQARLMKDGVLRRI
jgi:hypothetical protein